MLCKVSSSFEQITQHMTKYFGSIHNEKWNSSEGKIAVILGESYYIRANSNAAIFIIIKETSPSETNLELISFAGSSGVLELSWGTHGAYVNRIKNSLEKSGFTIEVTKEIPNYNSSPINTLKPANQK